ncbi:PepSY-associated TM helix domain-containing protein [Parashewanella tropica]|uniref:PepSY-associated TM helix domain-containing protein n=1 Tax=Parashewanella tropica TaxID=2547970 RepID=UPI001059FD18|nr:PepSY-associated TM helix domain-containing protein [Parashewanella tropica]
MKSRTIKKLFSIHAWVGIITGILLFVIAFTGSLSVFGKPELKIWANPTYPSVEQMDMKKIEQLVNHYAQDIPKPYLEEVTIFLPSIRGFQNLTLFYEAHSGIEDSASEANKKPEERGYLIELDPVTYELVTKKEGTADELFESREYGMANFIIGFHADLHLGRPIGLLLTGVLGLTLLLSVVTGFIIHRKKLAQLFTFRREKNTTLTWNDGHKILGIWGMLFHGIIGFTGAFLGLIIVVLVPAAAFVSFEGDQDKLLETFTATPEVTVQHIAAPMKIAEVLETEKTTGGDREIASITIKEFGDKGALALVSVYGGSSIAFQTSVYNAADATFVERYSNLSKVEGFSGPIIDLMFPLHYGNFGGILVKLIWTILGLSTTLLPLTGMMLWIRRGLTSTNPEFTEKTYKRFNRFILGSCGGVVLASFALFPAQLLLDKLTAIENVGAAMFYVFFPIWGLCTLFAFFYKNEQQTAKLFTWITSLCLISILPIKLALFGYLSNGSNINPVAIGVDIICLLLGIGILYLLKQFQAQNENEPNNLTIEQGVNA